MRKDPKIVYIHHSPAYLREDTYCRAANAILPYNTILPCADCPLYREEYHQMGEADPRCRYFTTTDSPATQASRDFERELPISNTAPTQEELLAWTTGKIAAGELPRFPEFVGPTGADESLHLFQRALQYAADAHAGTCRKGTTIPYITHPIEAAGIVRTMTDDVRVWAAAALHDVVEDTDHTVGDIRREFGTEIARLVADESEDKMDDRPAADTWQARKEAVLEHLAGAPYDAKLIALGDKLSNLRALCRDYAQVGPALWECFNQKDPAKQAWYYRTMLDKLAVLEDKAAYREYRDKLNALFGEIKQD